MAWDHDKFDDEYMPTESTFKIAVSYMNHLGADWASPKNLLKKYTHLESRVRLLITFVCYGEATFSKILLDEIKLMDPDLPVGDICLHIADKFAMNLAYLSKNYPIAPIPNSTVKKNSILEPLEISFGSLKLPGPYRLSVTDTSSGVKRYVVARKKLGTDYYDVGINSTQRANWSSQFSFDDREAAYQFAKNLGKAKTNRDVSTYSIRIIPVQSPKSTLNADLMLRDRVLVKTPCGPAFLSKSCPIYESFRPVYLKEDIEVHDELNPKLFNEDDTLKDEVINKIEEIVTAFTDDLAEDGVDIVIDDIVLIGSNVSYNYTKDSDIDIHIIANTSDMEYSEEIYSKLYSAYRSLFNRKLNIDFYGIPVELYVETENTEKRSNGIYSVRKNEWIKHPEKSEIIQYDKNAFNDEFDKLESEYLDFIDNENITSKDVTDFIERVYEFRMDGLKTPEAEFSIGNLVFKEFRNKGYLDNLKDLKNEILSKELSL